MSYEEAILITQKKVSELNALGLDYKLKTSRKKGLVGSFRAWSLFFEDNEVFYTVSLKEMTLYISGIFAGAVMMKGKM